jgi:peptide/nickel transport system permease protein
MPALALSALPLGFTTLVLMAAIRGEYGAQYVTVARSKGLSERLVAWRHVLRNAALVMATQIGLLVISLMNGTVLIEAVFAWPGLGQVTLQAVQSRDLPVVMAAVVYLGLIVTLVNLAVDLAYARLDPRVRLT